MEGDIAHYIVVGAGSAGAVIAARLTEDPKVSVVLLEAGGRDRNLWLHIPLGYGKTMTDARVNWMYKTEPEPNCAGREIFWPRGKVLGGTSAINGLVYIRGQVEDFDHWRQLGNEGWSFEDVLPHFKRAEGNVRGGDDLHGGDGPLGVSDLESHPLCEAFIAGAQEAGIPRNPDFNGRIQEGVGYFQLTTRRGFRSSTSVAYLRKARSRPNLRIVTGAQATRVLLDGKTIAFEMVAKLEVRNYSAAVEFQLLSDEECKSINLSRTKPIDAMAEGETAQTVCLADVAEAAKKTAAWNTRRAVELFSFVTGLNAAVPLDR